MNAQDVLDALAELLADRVAEKVAARLAATPAAPELATAKHNPLGSARAFLDAARAGRFPSWRRGKEVVARWEDVSEYDRARMRPRPARTAPTPPPTQQDEIEASLRRAGLL